MITKDRKTPNEIKEDILIELEKGPKNISEIADNIKSNWITTEKFLTELEDEKKIIELISASKSKVYASKKDLSFFYLPLSQKIREKTLSLLFTINKLWKEENKQSPQRTILQKIAVKFVEENNLQEEIPILRNHYGQTLALRFEEDSYSKEFSLSESQKKILKSLIKKYKSLTSSAARLEQYEKPSMHFYNQKEKLLKDFSKEDKIESNFFDLLLEYPSELSLSFEVFNREVFCAVNILNSKEINEYLPRLRETFSLIWDCLTTELYFYDAEKLIDKEKIELFNQIKSNYLNSKITNVSNVLEEFENEVVSLEPNKSSYNLSESVHELFNE